MSEVVLLDESFRQDGLNKAAGVVPTSVRTRDLCDVIEAVQQIRSRYHLNHLLPSRISLNPSSFPPPSTSPPTSPSKTDSTPICKPISIHPIPSPLHSPHQKPKHTKETEKLTSHPSYKPYTSHSSATSPHHPQTLPRHQPPNSQKYPPDPVSGQNPADADNHIRGYVLPSLLLPSHLANSPRPRRQLAVCFALLWMYLCWCWCCCCCWWRFSCDVKTAAVAAVFAARGIAQLRIRGLRRRLRPWLGLVRLRLGLDLRMSPTRPVKFPEN